MRRHAECTPKNPQKVERAQVDGARAVVEREFLARVSLDEEGGLDRTTAIHGRTLRRATLVGDDLDEAGREQHRHLIEAEVASAVANRLRELTEHHELPQRRNHRRSPDRRAAPHPLHERRIEAKPKTLIAGDMVVRALELVPRKPNEERPRHQEVGATSARVPEAALAHVRERILRVNLGERSLVTRVLATKVDRRDGRVLGKYASRHPELVSATA